MFSFSVRSWRNQMDTADQKYKPMEVAVEEPKWARPREIHCSLRVSRRSTGRGKHLTQYHNTLSHLYTIAADTHCAWMQLQGAFCFHYVRPVAASFISLIPLFKHYDVWRSTDQYQTPADSDDCITTLLETTGAGWEMEEQRQKEVWGSKEDKYECMRQKSKRIRERESMEGRLISSGVLAYKESFTALQTLCKTEASIHDSLAVKRKIKYVE